MQEPLITLVVPIYQVEVYLPRCIDSIIRQTYMNIQILLIDDGSTDNCPRICDEYARRDKRIRVVHKENGGLADARNAGINRARGEYITFVDSDDYIAGEYVEYLLELIESNNGDISICDMRIIRGGEPLEGKEETNTVKVLTPEQALECILYQKEFDVSACGKLYKTELFSDIRYPKGKLFEDFATTYKLINKSQSIVFGSQKYYLYYLRPQSIITSSFTPGKMDLIQFSGEMTNFIFQNYPKLKNAVIRRDVFSHFHVLRQMVYCKPRRKQEEKSFVRHIRKNSKVVLNDPKATKRDKAAILCLFFGIGFFKLSWRMYCSFLK